MYIQQLGEIFRPPNQNTVAACDQITCLTLYYISSRPVTLLKVTDAPIPVPYIFYLSVSYKILNFGFQIDGWETLPSTNASTIQDHERYLSDPSQVVIKKNITHH